MSATPQLAPAVQKLILIVDDSITQLEAKLDPAQALRYE